MQIDAFYGATPSDLGGTSEERTVTLYKKPVDPTRVESVLFLDGFVKNASNPSEKKLQLSAGI
jgi:hypothetical protein